MAVPLSRFRATPEEIHAFLTEYLAEDVHLRYQQVIGAAAVREAAFSLHARADQVPPFGEHDEATALRNAADDIDPDHHGGPWPSVLVRRFGRGKPEDEEIQR